jgi:hypothetical protein
MAPGSCGPALGAYLAESTATVNTWRAREYRFKHGEVVGRLILKIGILYQDKIAARLADAPLYGGALPPILLID